MDDDQDASGTGESGEPVDSWLQPLDGDPCGEDLEYDNDFLELSQAAAGKPETQFAPAEPPDWRAVGNMAESLFGRTRDLRVALLWGRSRAAQEGWGTLPESLRLIHGLLERYWDDLHPKPDPDDGDPYARLNALQEMTSPEGLLGELRQAAIIRDRSVGELRGRDLEIALDRLIPREDETPLSRAQVEQMLADAVASDESLAAMPGRCVARLEAIGELLRERVGYERAPDFDGLTSLFKALSQLMPSGDGSSAGRAERSDDGDSGDGPAPAREGRRSAGGGGLGDGVETREDAQRAIEMVCAYLERTEPTNPAQMLLRRASVLMNKNFLELVGELAPEALAEVAKIMGVPADSIRGGASSSEDEE